MSRAAAPPRAWFDALRDAYLAERAKGEARGLRVVGFHSVFLGRDEARQTWWDLIKVRIDYEGKDGPESATFRVPDPEDF